MLSSSRGTRAIEGAEGQVPCRSLTHCLSQVRLSLATSTLSKMAMEGVEAVGEVAGRIQYGPTMCGIRVLEDSHAVALVGGAGTTHGEPRLWNITSFYLPLRNIEDPPSPLKNMTHTCQDHPHRRRSQLHAPQDSGQTARHSRMLQALTSQTLMLSSRRMTHNLCRRYNRLGMAKFPINDMVTTARHSISPKRATSSPNIRIRKRYRMELHHTSILGSHKFWGFQVQQAWPPWCNEPCPHQPHWISQICILNGRRCYQRVCQILGRQNECMDMVAICEV